MTHGSARPLRDRFARSFQRHASLAPRALAPAAAAQPGFLEALEPRLFLAADPLLVAFPQSILAHTGHADVAVVGDVDGDGWRDVLVGNYGSYTTGRTTGSTSGAVLLSGRDGSTIREHDVRGNSVSALGDVDGDGVPDYVVGSRGISWIDREDPDYVSVFSGASGAEIARLAPAEGVNAFGASVLGLGDVNGDGVPDLAVAAADYSTGDGLVLIYSGAEFQQLAEARFAASYLAIAQSAPDLAPAGDVDGDGAADFISRGDLIFSGATGQVLRSLDSAAISEEHPAQTIRASDLDGDGVDDFVSSFLNEQVIVAFSGADGSLIRTIITSEYGFGKMADIGDRTGDGVDELAIVTRGPGEQEDFIYNYVSVFSVADPAGAELLQRIDVPDMTVTTPGTYSGDPRYYATDMATGDVNGDGRTDLLTLTHMHGGYGTPIGPGRVDLFFGQDMGAATFDPATIAAGSNLSVASDDGLLVAGVNRYGDLIAFTRGSTDAPWQFDTLLEDAGVLAADVFHDPRTGRLSIAVSTYDQFLLFSLDAAGQWRTTIIDEAPSITRLMQAFVFADGRIGIVGTGTGLFGYGDGLYLYEQSGDGWTSTNISSDLVNHGQAAPDFRELTVYVAPWNAVHITGRGPAGVSTVWRSHLTPSWVYTPIGQQVPEAQALTNLSAFVAPWGGLHVAGVTPDGHVGVLWWSFELLETGWEYTDLTATQNGPLFKQAPITTYVTDWGGLNIVGVDVDGDLSAYWWVPGFGADWVTEAIALDPGSTTLVDPVAVLDSIFEPRHNGMRITAASADGDVIIYTWRPAQGATWLFEDLSATVA